jgi:cbb3-type cytochrome oxidase subunit 3
MNYMNMNGINEHAVNPVNADDAPESGYDASNAVSTVEPGGNASGAVSVAASGTVAVASAVEPTDGADATVSVVESGAAIEPAVYVAGGTEEKPDRLRLDPAAELAVKPAGISLDWRFTAFLPVMGFLFIKWVAYGGGHGISVTVFTLMFAASALLWFKARNIRPSNGVYLYLGWILLAALSFTLYRNPMLETILLLLIIAAVPYFFAAACEVRTENRLGGFLILDAWDALLSIPFGGSAACLSAFGAGLKRGRLSKGILFTLLGVLLTLPVTMGVAILLRQADAAFDALWLRLNQRFTLTLTTNITQALLSLPATLYLFGLFYGTNARKGSPKRTPEQAAALANRCRLLPGAFAAGCITPLLCMYVLFFLSQTAYFLNAFKGLLPAGMTYAEYARRGFFELCTVSGINLVLIVTLALFARRGAGIMRKIYTLALSLFSIALIVISLRKMLLYIGYYGLTPKRLETSWFMVFLLLVFLLNILWVFRPSFNLVRWSAAAGAVMLLMFCYADISALIPNYNVDAYRDGRLAQLDLDILRDLGDGATPRLLEVMLDEEMDGGLRESARMILWERASQVRRQDMDAAPDWRGWTLAGSRSDHLLREHSAQILAGPPAF